MSLTPPVMALRAIVRVELLPPKDPRYPGNARRRLTLSCGHEVVRSHVSGRHGRARCDVCVKEP